MSQKISLAGEDTFSQRDLLLLMRESLHEHASGIRQEREMLHNHLILLKKQLEPLEQVKTECQHLGMISARRYVNSFAGIILGQYFLTQYGTYVAFSWDIIEPIACCMTMSDALIAYIFWVNTGRPWDVNGLRDHFQTRKMNKAIKKNIFDQDKYNNLKQAIEQVETKLNELK